jgi:cysteine-rich repeat protein
VLTGEACTAHCAPQPITEIVQGDGCCPPGADMTSDEDCDPVCGNHVIEHDESCDPPESCPTTCTSDNACLTAVATGSAAACNAKCELVPVIDCKNGDGCCPDGCTQARDDDCSASCGDGFIDPKVETCEAGSATPCPASCDDGKRCTSNVRTGSDSNCNVRCTFPDIVLPANDDGCCPPNVGANANNDNDCSAVCGNGVVETGERCDGNCPQSCNDNKVCTADTVIGSGCSRRCNFADITEPANGDGCCPANNPAANNNNDADCPVVCGNGVVEAGEGCDDQNTKAGDGCFNCQIETSEQLCLGIIAKNDACTLCSCHSCTDVTVACFGSSDATLNARCKALVECGQAHDCSGDDCYCGTVDPIGCFLGWGNGACRSEVEAAAGSTSPNDVLSRKNDTRYALGRANAVVECALMSCRSQCGL